MKVNVKSRRWLRVSDARAAISVTLALVFVVAGCGGENGSETRTVTKTVTQAPEATPTQPSAERKKRRPSCAAASVEPEETICEGDGLTAEIVNKGNRLRLQELDARVLQVEATDSISVDGERHSAEGRFAVVTLAITNRTSDPQTFDPGDDTTLLVAGKTFSVNEDVYLDNALDTEDIQPGMTREGTVLFDIPRREADATTYGTNSFLVISNFSDSIAFLGSGGQGTATLRVGFLRTAPLD